MTTVNFNYNLIIFYFPEKFNFFKSFKTDEQDDANDKEYSTEEEENGPDEGLFNHERILLLLEVYQEFYDDLRRKHAHHYSI